MSSPKRQRVTPSLRQDFPVSTSYKKPPKSVIIAGRTLPINRDILDLLFNWMAERDRIRRRRVVGQSPPWTKNKIMQTNKFCNVFRDHDRGTQYMISEVINKGDRSFKETCFRVILYNCFKRESTWEALVAGLGPLKWSTFKYRAYGAVLATHHQGGQVPLYTAAYQIPPPGYGHAVHYKNHLEAVETMMKDGLPRKLLAATSMKDMFELVCQYRGIGQFIGYQLVLDLNTIPQLRFSENEWASTGPGSKGCLEKIFGSRVSGIEFEAMKYLYKTQDEHFARLGILDPPCKFNDGPPGVNITDIEHSLCETNKYHLGRGGRTKSWKPRDILPPSVIPRNQDERFSAPRFATTPVETPVLSEQEDPFDMVSAREVSPQPYAQYQPEYSPLSDIDMDRVVEPERPPTPLWTEGYENDDTEYEISHIYRERLGSDGWEFKVQWVGWGSDHDTWLPESAFGHAKEILKAWRRRNPRSRDKTDKKRAKKVVSRITKGRFSTPVPSHRRERKGEGITKRRRSAPEQI